MFFTNLSFFLKYYLVKIYIWLSILREIKYINITCIYIFTLDPLPNKQGEPITIRYDPYRFILLVSAFITLFIHIRTFRWFLTSPSDNIQSQICDWLDDHGMSIWSFPVPTYFCICISVLQHFICHSISMSKSSDHTLPQHAYSFINRGEFNGSSKKEYHLYSFYKSLLLANIIK